MIKKIRWMMLTLSFVFPLIVLANPPDNPPTNNNPNGQGQKDNTPTFFDKKEYKDLQQYKSDDVVNLDEEDMSRDSS